MKIVVMVEGKTEKAFGGHLRTFLKGRKMPDSVKIVFDRQDGGLPRESSLRQSVADHLRSANAADFVIGLTDVYTGDPRVFEDAADAKQKMRNWVGPEQRFIPHAAQYEFEAWLLPFWDRIQQLSGSNRVAPPSPETVNHNRPPSALLRETYRTGRRASYIKTVECSKILQGQDLTVAAKACPELKAFLNTLLKLGGGDLIA